MTRLVKTDREGAKKHLEETQYGVLLVGDVGVGKTYLVRKPRMTSANELSIQFQLNGIESVNALINNQIHYQGGIVVIDDIGTEPVAKNFGTDLDVVTYVIQRLYDINQVAEKPIKLYMTTNLNQENLIERYGNRVVDRIYEMCDRVIIQDTNLRRP